MKLASLNDEDFEPDLRQKLQILQQYKDRAVAEENFD